MSKMNDFAATMIAEGEWEMAGFEESTENYLAAFQHLIDTGLAWSLQGRVGREAMRLVEAGEVHMINAEYRL